MFKSTIQMINNQLFSTLMAKTLGEKKASFRELYMFNLQDSLDQPFLFVHVGDRDVQKWWSNPDLEFNE